jgi:hypothetical protein
MERIAGAVQIAPADAAIAAPAALAPTTDGTRRVTAAGRSLSLSIPGNDAYLTSSSIPVAGTAFGRPHGPTVAMVHVELIAGGQSIDSADIPVYSGRFAGVLQAPTLDGPTNAELRISDPLHKGVKAVVREVTIDQR